MRRGPDGRPIGSRWKGRFGGARTLLGAAFALGLAAPLGAGCVGQRAEVCQVNSDCAAGTVCSGEGFCTWECAQDQDCPCGSFCARTCGLCVRDDFLGPATCFAFQNGLDTDAVLGACRANRPEAGQASPVAVDEPLGGGAVATDARPVGDGSSSDAASEGGQATSLSDGDIDASPALGSEPPATDSGVCNRPLLTLPMCVSSPPQVDAQPTVDAPTLGDDGGGDASDDSSEDATLSDSHDDTGSSDDSTSSEAGPPESGPFDGAADAGGGG